MSRNDYDPLRQRATPYGHLHLLPQWWDEVDQPLRIDPESPHTPTTFVHDFIIEE